MRIIYNANGQIKGRLDEGNFGLLGVYDRNGNKLGIYVPTADHTLDKNGRIVGAGDQRMMLLEEN